MSLEILDCSSALSAISLSNRELNRALLARQMLLERRPTSVGSALEALVGLQGQAPLAPYVALWSRSTEPPADDLAGLLTSRRVLRAPLMRGTVHLTTAADFMVFRPLVQPVLERMYMSTPFATRLRGASVERVADAATELLVEPLSRAELGQLLARRFRRADPLSLAYAATYVLPVTQAPPRGLWGKTGAARWISVEAWLGRRVPEEPSSADARAIVLRYLTAFGPASVADFAAWSGLPGAEALFSGLRSELLSFRDEAGRELLDVHDGLRPPGDVPAPVRFLPEYDNVLFAHANRERVIARGLKPPAPPGNGARRGTVLVDGFMRAEWQLRQEAGRHVLHVEPLTRLARPERSDIFREARLLLRFLVPGAVAVEVGPSRGLRPTTPNRAA